MILLYYYNIEIEWIINDQEEKIFFDRCRLSSNAPLSPHDAAKR